jgi:hypothetical protein
MNLTRVEKLNMTKACFGKWCLLSICLLMSGFATAGSGIVHDTSHVKVKVKKTVVLNNAPDTTLIKKCGDIEVITTVIEEAISVGAPTYNSGNPMGCYRIYEGAAYKILYKYGKKCKEVKNILETALEKSYGDYPATQKAWIMRMAFDSILGVPTTTTK